MKPVRIFLLVLTALLTISAHMPPLRKESSLALQGAWKQVSPNGKPLPHEQVRIFSEGYAMFAQYRTAEKTFLRAGGGPYTFDGTLLSLSADYDSQDSSLVGKTALWQVKARSSNEIELTLKQGGKTLRERWLRLDEGKADLAGDWRIRLRMGDAGVMNEIKPSPRKTIKILSGTRFQWAAMNTETKQFSGTGGGTYTFENGVYTEKIEFFSRDSSRVGLSLSFQGAVEGDDWTHKGKSSRGQEIHEVWRRE